QVKQIRSYGPPLVTYIFEHELDIEQFFDRTGLYVDYKTFVAFMDVYGPTIHMVLKEEEEKENKILCVFHKFKNTLGDKYMINALFNVRNFHAALTLYDAIPKGKSFDVDKLRFLAKVTRFPLDAFSILQKDDLFLLHASVVRALRVKTIREAVEKGNL